MTYPWLVVLITNSAAQPLHHRSMMEGLEKFHILYALGGGWEVLRLGSTDG
jgi:hypothetical protein